MKLLSPWPGWSRVVAAAAPSFVILLAAARSQAPVVNAPVVSAAVVTAQDLLAGQPAEARIPIGCVHANQMVQEVPKGARLCQKCEAAMQDFRNRQRAGLPVVEINLCGQCPQPVAVERQHLVVVPHLADVASRLDVCESMAWLAGEAQIDPQRLTRGLLHLDFLQRVPTAVLEPMLVAAIGRVDHADTRAPWMARLVILFSARKPMVLQQHTDFVLRNLKDAGGGFVVACLADFGSACAPAWRKNPQVLEFFAAAVTQDVDAPKEAFVCLQRMRQILASGEPLRDVECADPVVVPAAIANAPRVLPWEWGGETVPAAPAAPVVSSDKDLKQRKAHAMRQGDHAEAERLLARMAYRNLVSSGALAANVLKDRRQLEATFGAPLLAFAPEVQVHMQLADYRELAERAHRVLQQVAGLQSTTPKTRLYYERLAGALDACSTTPQSTAAVAMWAWVVDDAVLLEQVKWSDAIAPVGSVPASAAAPGAARTIDWAKYDRTLQVPEWVRTAARVSNQEMEAVDLFDYWPAAMPTKPTRELSDFATGLVTRIAANQGLRASLGSALQRYHGAFVPKEGRNDAALRALEAQLAEAKRPYSYNRFRKELAAGGRGRMQEPWPADLLGTDLDSTSWRNLVAAWLARAAASVNDPKNGAFYSQLYLDLHRLQRLVTWGDFGEAQDMLDRRWRDVFASR